MLTASFYHGLYAKQQVIRGEVERRNYGDIQKMKEDENSNSMYLT